MRSKPQTGTLVTHDTSADARSLLHAELPRLPFAAAVIDENRVVFEANEQFPIAVSDDTPASDRLLDQLLHPDDVALLQTVLLLLKANPDKPQRIELRLRQPDDRFHWMLAACATVPTPDRRALFILQLVEIDQQKRQYINLGERESRWNYALVNSGLGVWDHNVVTGAMYYSDTWYSIRGLAPGAPVPPTTEEWLQLVHPDDRDRIRHSIEQQNAGNPDYAVFEYREKHTNGSYVWIECRGGCVEWDENGNALRMMGTDIDITARKNAERELSQMSRRLKLALDVSRVGVFEADFTTGVSTWDDRMFTIFGFEGRPRIEIGGLWETAVHPDDIGRVQEKVNYHVERFLPFSDQYRILLQDGNERFIRSHTLPFIDTDGHQKMIGANWDVTQDMALHRELDRARLLAEARNRELELAKARIEHNALHDYLTGLPNRRYLDEALDRIAGQSFEDDRGIAILHIDLDRFKQINDTLGHNAGDAMLRHAASILSESVLPGDFVARIGGDEFLLVSMIKGSTRRLNAVADEIIRKLCKPVDFEGHTVRFGASIGIACGFGSAIDAKQLLLNADIALYRAKGRGRNRHEFFSLDLQNKIINAKRLADEVLLGLEQQQFAPYYQPQFDARTLDVTGVETLARWFHPKKGVLTPDRFLAAAEDLDVVSTIDGLVLEQALRDLNTWRTAGIDIPRVSVNVSFRRLNDPGLMKKLQSLTIRPGTVSFELLESIFLDNCDDDTVENIAKIRQLGIDVEVDDFGTGHASIVSLLKIEPQALKIDRQLVKPITVSADQRRLVRSIIEIGKSLNIKVVAEGVETAEHVRILQDMECDILQGYALARPMPFTEIEEFIRDQSWRKILS